MIGAFSAQHTPFSAGPQARAGGRFSIVVVTERCHCDSHWFVTTSAFKKAFCLLRACSSGEPAPAGRLSDDTDRSPANKLGKFKFNQRFPQALIFFRGKTSQRRQRIRNKPLDLAAAPRRAVTQAPDSDRDPPPPGRGHARRAAQAAASLTVTDATPVAESGSPGL